jgi:NAD(P)-dependent dehydrogenase (short-subunit alcohol dehydrogenase family)
MPGMVEGKVALVTGAGGGIGRAATSIFAREGAAHVYAVDIDPALAAETVELVGADRATALVVDVTDEDAVQAMVERIVAEHGRLDCAFNNAGINDVSKPFFDFTAEEWHRMIAVNLTSVFFCMKHELRQMVAQGGGAICNTSSGAGLVAAPGLPHYTAAKHGVLGLVKSAAQEFNNADVRVNAVCPGMVDTPMIRSWFDSSPAIANAVLATMPGGRLRTPEEIAESAVWLCSDHAGGVSGLSMVVDGGFMNR